MVLSGAAILLLFLTLVVGRLAARFQARYLLALAAMQGHRMSKTGRSQWISCSGQNDCNYIFRGVALRCSHVRSPLRESKATQWAACPAAGALAAIALSVAIAFEESSSDAASRFSRRWPTEDVPGISRILLER
jgi:hypothetical protein